MLDLISQTFNASLIAVTQLFLSAVITTNPWFELLDVQYHQSRSQIVCTTKLDASFTETLDGVLLSGQNITLHFVFEFFADGGHAPLAKMEVVNGFRYDKDDEVYYLYSSQTKQLERYFTLEAAKDAYISVRDLVTVNTKNLSTEEVYFIKVSAFLDPIEMDDMETSVNLMLRWASVKPTIVSEKFRLTSTST